MRNLILVSSLLLICAFLVVSITAPKSNKQVVANWLSDKTSLEPNLLCQGLFDGIGMYIARTDEGVKVGHLLNVDRDNDAPYSYIFSWGFQNSDGVYLVQEAPSVDESKQYVRLEGDLYAESIESLEIRFEAGDRIAFTAIVHRYEPSVEIKKDLRSLVKNNENSLIEICNVEV